MQEGRARVLSGPVQSVRGRQPEVYRWGGLLSQSTEVKLRQAKVLHDELEQLPLDRRGISAVEPRVGCPETAPLMRALSSDVLRYAGSTREG